MGSFGMKEIEEDRGIRAKTGTMSGVSCLSGYVFTKSDDPLAFSIMMNGSKSGFPSLSILADSIGNSAKSLNSIKCSKPWRHAIELKEHLGNISLTKDIP